ncbi:hypothetical protein WJX75_008170 [Coccomyxa subellipsoidea]|uniref:Uncharacterized protein n=1 Tax=Coccomyxa subellipsoidea TaxID=248742 RepID=A0ABR2YSB5_9CHLO
MYTDVFGLAYIPTASAVPPVCHRVPCVRLTSFGLSGSQGSRAFIFHQPLFKASNLRRTCKIMQRRCRNA